MAGGLSIDNPRLPPCSHHGHPGSVQAEGSTQVGVDLRPATYRPAPIQPGPRRPARPLSARDPILKLSDPLRQVRFSAVAAPAELSRIVSSFRSSRQIASLSPTAVCRAGWQQPSSKTIIVMSQLDLGETMEPLGSSCSLLDRLARCRQRPSPMAAPGVGTPWLRLFSIASAAHAPSWILLVVASIPQGCGASHLELVRSYVCRSVCLPVCLFIHTSVSSPPFHEYTRPHLCLRTSTASSRPRRDVTRRPPPRSAAPRLV